MDQFEKDWALFLTAKDGNIEEAKKLIKDGANPNFMQPQTGRLKRHQLSSVLRRAVNRGHKDYIEFLFENGAVIPKEEDWQKRIGDSARSSGRPDILIYLIEQGLPVDPYFQQWAENKGHTELKDFLEAKVGPRRIQYDIDEMLEVGAYQFVLDFAGIVPQYYDVASKKLFDEEIVVRDIGEFLIDTGSGFSTMYTNEHFDTFERAHSALSLIQDSLAIHAIREVRSTLSNFGYPTNPDEALDFDSSLDDKTREKLEEAFEDLDRKFFYSDKSQSLWSNLDYIDKTVLYVREHIEIFRKRKA